MRFIHEKVVSAADIIFDVGGTMDIPQLSFPNVWETKGKSSYLTLGYRQARYLGETIESVLAQTYSHHEIVSWMTARRTAPQTSSVVTQACDISVRIIEASTQLAIQENRK
jgi:hypothetical protein